VSRGKLPCYRVSQWSYVRQSDSYHHCCRLVRRVLPQKRAMRGQVSRCFEWKDCAFRVRRPRRKSDANRHETRVLLGKC